MLSIQALSCDGLMDDSIETYFALVKENTENQENFVPVTWHLGAVLQR